MNNKITLLLLGLFAVACNAKPASAFTSPFNIDNSDFTVDPGTLGSNSAAGNSTINTTSTTDSPYGFGTQFDTSDTNSFLLLGAVDVDSGINDGGNKTLNSTNVNATSTPFMIDSVNIAVGTVDFEFDYSFQGTDDFSDNFNIELRPENAAIGTGTRILRTGNYGGGSVSQNIDISGLSEGNYVVGISLTEATGDTDNSAAGFDNFVVSQTAPPATPVPFGAAPNTGIFILGSLYAGSSYLKRRKMSK